MNQKIFNTIVLVVLTLAGGLHLIRSILGWDLVLNGMAIPIWLSLMVAILAAYLVLVAARLNKK